MHDETIEEGQPGGIGHLGRRKFVAATAVGAAAAWATPTVLSMQAAAAQSAVPVPPDFVDFGGVYDPPGVGNTVRRAKPTTGSGANPLAAGDLWLCVVAYYEGAGVNNIPAAVPGVQAVWGPVNHGTGIYSVETWLIARVLQAGDISGGVYSPAATFQTNNDPATFGGLRVSTAAYRDPNGGPLTLPTAAEVANATGAGAVGFPALGTTPVTPNKVVRLGSVRGYGGLDVGGPITWTTVPGTLRVLNAGGNHGDRAIAISDDDNSTGGTAGGNWNYAGAAAGDRHWTGWTVAIPAP